MKKGYSITSGFRPVKIIYNYKAVYSIKRVSIFSLSKLDTVNGFFYARNNFMNTDIRVSITVLTNKKIRKLIRRKGYEGFYNLISLWLDAAAHCPDGLFKDYYDEDLMMAANTEDNKFIGLLLEIGLLDQCGEWVKIHDWKDNNPWASQAEIRSKSAKKAAEIRWSKNQKTKISKAEKSQ